MLELPLTVEEYMAERDSILETLFPSAAPMPGATALTQRFHLAIKVPIAVATSSNFGSVDLKLTNHREWFNECFEYEPKTKEGRSINTDISPFLFSIFN